ncbi:MAG: pyridoxal-phosphate dependent enzyme [Sphaerochaetaceae bacterium]|nr:pyridoxal-phosphate dependent enzyme [Sphaerochaetaceae bacterium]
MRFHYECNDCHAEYDSGTVMYRCPACSNDQHANNEFSKGNLIVRPNREDLTGIVSKETWTYHDLLPYPIFHRDSYPVGNTALVRPHRLAERYGMPNVFCKLEGSQPSGSFKDRASQLVAAQAIAHGESKIALASTGNAGAAMSCAGAAYGLQIILFVPEHAPANKLMQSVLYGATVVPVKGTYDDAFALSIAYTDHFGGINRNTAYNPMTVEGKKSVSIELYQQLQNNVPDAVYVPVGDGCIYAGVYKGFYDLKEAGLIKSVPPIICVQSAESNAISQAWKHNTYRTVHATTKADSINVSSPANGRMAVRYIRESNGWATEVSDQEIFDAQLELARDAGIFVEPAAACAWAGFVKDREKLCERFTRNASVCVLLTGVGFKDMAAFTGKAPIPLSIENSVDAVLKRFKK